ncbi:hypothetical protein XELAEV_18023827mg [Xenopus laevis]|uniref:Uncharacterized protein n=1 Tax=Xenopus laevis TaxID=8355 RepID=A0A974HPP2_XENLA|nr:hypothetical protein XELAEV_18023827mg [Xenopus laevis]
MASFKSKLCLHVICTLHSNSEQPCCQMRTNARTNGVFIKSDVLRCYTNYDCYICSGRTSTGAIVPSHLFQWELQIKILKTLNIF